MRAYAGFLTKYDKLGNVRTNYPFFSMVNVTLSGTLDIVQNCLKQIHCYF